MLCKKQGQVTDEEWQDTLTTYQEGERSSATYHTSAYRSGGAMFDKDADSSVVSPSYCPSCQLKAQQNF